MHSKFWLTNALLETGYFFENGKVVQTETSLHHLLVEHGKFSKIIPAYQRPQGDFPKVDVKNLLLLPSFIEKHCHLDKTMLGDRWRAVTPVRNIFERLEIEKRVLPSLSTTIKERANNLLNTYVQMGVTHIRTHVDIYPEVGLKNLEEVQQALQSFNDKLSHEIVAFPQHGLLRTKSKQLVRESLRQGAGLVGSVDPATVDGDIEAALQEIVTLAVEENAGIDLHLHDAHHLGTFTIKRLAELTIEANLQGKVAVSHAFSLGDISNEEAFEMADLLTKADMEIITSVPINRKFPPVDLLDKKGVSVAVGCDNIFDMWSPFGNGDVLERVSRLAEYSNWVDERSLARALKFITGGKTPLSENGEKLWPKIGDDASIVFVEATCSAEMIARRSRRIGTMFKGNLISGSIG